MHTYWWIFHVQPQSEQQKTLMFVYTSVLFCCIQVVLIMTYYSNTKRKHKGFTLAYYKSCSEEENFFLLWWMQLHYVWKWPEIFLKSEQTHNISLHWTKVPVQLFFSVILWPLGAVPSKKRVIWDCLCLVDFISNGRSIRDIIHWFVDCCFEAMSFDCGHCHLVFLEPDVTIF